MHWYYNGAALDWRCPAAPTDVQAFHRGLADYSPTPLTDVPSLATELGVGRVLVKDESERLGLGAFKALGAWWAIHCAIQEHDPQIELVTATDGNHGRAVARMAAMLRVPAHVFVPDMISERAVDAIRAEAAIVTVVAESYDAAVAAAAAAATGNRVLIQDAAWPGYEVVPQRIVDGYSTLFREIDVQPDLVVVPMGVGSVAQAAVTHYRSGATAPVVLGVEPARAACVMASLKAGELVSISTGTTVMAGLNCGTPSSLAWPVLRAGLSAAVTVEEGEAVDAERDLGAAGISSGASGAATLAGLRATLAAGHREELGLTAVSTVVLISTEASPEFGATL